MPNIYRFNEGQSIDGRQLMDAMRKLRVDYDVVAAKVERIVQAQDTPFGTLSVRSDNTNGQVTLNAGHGIVAGQFFNLYFSGGARIKCVAGSVSGNNVPFSGGTGDNLPSQDTPVDVVHYKTAADLFEIVDASGTQDPNAAFEAYNELASMLASAGPSLKQATARLVSY